MKVKKKDVEFLRDINVVFLDDGKRRGKKKGLCDS